MAIALDNATSLSSSAASPWTTGTHTVAGSNRLLLACFLSVGGDVITAVTYNGAAMSALKKGANDGAFGMLQIWGLLAPSTGSNTFTVTFSAGTVFLIALSYTGVAQSGLPDASATLNQTAGGSTMANAITTVADQAWVSCIVVNGTSTPTVNTNVTARATPISTVVAGDSNGPVTPAGAFTQTWNVNAASSCEIVQVSFAPAPSNGRMFDVF